MWPPEGGSIEEAFKQWNSVNDKKVFSYGFTGIEQSSFLTSPDVRHQLLSILSQPRLVQCDESVEGTCKAI